MIQQQTNDWILVFLIQDFFLENSKVAENRILKESESRKESFNTPVIQCITVIDEQSIYIILEKNRKEKSIENIEYPKAIIGLYETPL